jgi:hypothetical protein
MAAKCCRSCIAVPRGGGSWCAASSTRSIAASMRVGTRPPSPPGPMRPSTVVAQAARQFGQIEDVLVGQVAGFDEARYRGRVRPRAGGDHCLLEAQFRPVNCQRIGSDKTCRAEEHLHAGSAEPALSRQISCVRWFSIIMTRRAEAVGRAGLTRPRRHAPVRKCSQRQSGQLPLSARFGQRCGGVPAV